MKKSKKLFVAALSMAIIMTMSSTAFAAEGSSAALADKDYSLEEMLTYAIQDEYAAQAEYDAILEKYGVQRPFSNIIKSEVTHINLLLPLFDAYNVEIPVNSATESAVVPDSLQEGYTIGADAEVNNIAMYDSFLKENLPADVKSVFERLKAASENHLAAFERAKDGTLGLNNGNLSQSRGNAVQGNKNSQRNGNSSTGARGYGRNR